MKIYFVVHVHVVDSIFRVYRTLNSSVRDIGRADANIDMDKTVCSSSWGIEASGRS